MYRSQSPRFVKNKFSLGIFVVVLLPVIYIFVTLFMIIFGAPTDQQEHDKAMKQQWEIEFAKSLNRSRTGNQLQVDSLPEISNPKLFQTADDIERYYANALAPLGDIIKFWPPQDAGVSVRPSNWVDIVPRFDWNDPTSREAALRVRKAEKPFVIRNVPSVLEASAKWTDKYLATQFGKKRGTVEKSDSNSFMYWNGRGGRSRNRESSTNPTIYNSMSWSAFKGFAKELENTISGAPYLPHYYWHTNAKTDPWIGKDLKLFQKSDNFFIVDPSEFTVPIACRVGTKGLCNENHYDTHRTFAAQIVGSKRWIFLPPSECSKLYLYPERHISSRHSAVNINSGVINATKYPLAAQAMAVETVVHTGEVAYLPSNWFHHIISQEFNVQCIARSGHSLVGDDYIEKCGFKGGRGRSKIKKQLKV